MTVTSPRTNTLSTVLVLTLLLLVAVPWVLLSYQAYQEAKHEYLAQVGARLNVLAIDREQVTRLMLENRQQSLRVLAHETNTRSLAAELAKGKVTANSVYLDTVLRSSPYFDGLMIADQASGRQCSAGKLATESTAPLLQELHSQPSAQIIVSRPEGSPLLLLGERLGMVADGSQDQAILASAKSQFLVDLYGDNAALGSTGESFFSDNQGKPLTPLRYPRPVPGGEPIHAEAMQDCLRGHAQSFVISPDYVDVPTAMAYRQIAGYGGCVMVHMRADEVFAPVKAMRRKIILGNVSGGLAASLMAGLLAYKILKKERQLRDLAGTDVLTGVANRMLLMEQLEFELERARRFGTPMCLLMLDIDHFKTINDRYGHVVGDQVLKHFADVVGNNLRSVDILGRFGGEEFCVLLPNTGLDGGRQFAERLCQIVAATPAVVANKKIDYSVSIGVTAVLPHDVLLTHLIGRADAALYQAKEGGRNRVELG